MVCNELPSERRIQYNVYQNGGSEASTSGLGILEPGNEDLSSIGIDASENGQAGIPPGYTMSPDFPVSIPSHPKTKRRFPIRYVVVLMGFFAFVNMYMMYLNLTVAWPAMIDHNATELGTLDDQKGVFFEKSEVPYESLNPKNRTLKKKSLSAAHRKETHEHRSNKSKNNPVHTSDDKDHPITLSDKVRAPRMSLPLPPAIQDSSREVNDTAKEQATVTTAGYLEEADSHETDDISTTSQPSVIPTSVHSTIDVTEGTPASDRGTPQSPIASPLKSKKKRRKRSAQQPTVKVHSRVPKVVIKSPSTSSPISSPVEKPTTENYSHSGTSEMPNVSQTDTVPTVTEKIEIPKTPADLIVSPSPAPKRLDLDDVTTATQETLEESAETIYTTELPVVEPSTSADLLPENGVTTEAMLPLIPETSLPDIEVTTDSLDLITETENIKQSENAPTLPSSTTTTPIPEMVPTSMPLLELPETPTTVSEFLLHHHESSNDSQGSTNEENTQTFDNIKPQRGAGWIDIIGGHLAEDIPPIHSSMIGSELTSDVEEPIISTDLPSISTNLIETDKGVEKELKTTTSSYSSSTTVSPMPEFVLKVNGSIFQIINNSSDPTKANQTHPALQSLHSVVCGNSSGPCLLEQTYDVIDQKGANQNAGSSESFVTLRPLPAFNATDDHSYTNYGSGNHMESDEHEDQDSDENSHERKGNKGYRIKKITLQLGEHFTLKNCSISVRSNSTEFSLDRDIKCLNNLDVRALSIVFADGSSSSSSSSSSEEDDDDESNEEEESNEEDQEEDDEDEGDDDNNEHDEYERENREHEVNENDEENEDVNGEKDLLSASSHRKKFIASSSRPDGSDTENKLPTDNQKLNEKYTGTIEKLNEFGKVSCEDSSEECGDEEEETVGDPEEEDEEEAEEGDEPEEADEEGESETQVPETNESGRSEGLIILDGERVPSTVCFFKKKVSTSFDGYNDGEFAWKPQRLNEVTSAYYWGFLALQIPAGKLTSVLGGKIVLLMSLLLAGITTIVTPFLAEAGLYWLIAARVFLGMLLGLVMPAIQTLLAKWSPPMERTRMVAYTYSGIAVGAALGGPLSASLVQQIGWRALFFGQGVMAIMWCLLFFVLVSESPSQHTGIPSKEKQYILTAIGQQHAGRGLPVPWCSILQSRHVLSLMLAQGAFIWAWHSLLHYAPLYIASVLHEKLPDVQKVWAAALGCMFVTTCVYGTIADWARKSRKTSTITIRRAANSICSLVTAAFLVGVAQSYCNTEAVKVCFALAIAIGIPGGLCALFPNSIDLAPNHAGAVAGIAGAFATTANLLAPYYWVLVVYGQSTLERWRTIWYTSAIFLLLANCLYFLLVGTREQRWNRPLNVTKVTRRNDAAAAIPRRTNQGYKNQAYVSTERL